MGEFSIDAIDVRLELARRSDEESVCARSQSVRVELGYRRGDRGKPCAIGVGTETDGSIICPASVNGLVGLKPTVGLVSRTRHHSDFVSQDTAGPMGRTVADVALLLNALAGADEQRPGWRGGDGADSADYTAFLKADALRASASACCARPWAFIRTSTIRSERRLTIMKARGAEIVDVKIGTYNEWKDGELEVLLYEFKDGLNAYLKSSGSPHASLEALIAWNKANADDGDAVLRSGDFRAGAGQGSADRCRLSQGARRLAPACGQRRAAGSARSRQARRVIAPSMSPAWPTDHVLGDHFVGAGYGMAAVAGTPSITVPIGGAAGCRSA